MTHTPRRWIVATALATAGFTALAAGGVSAEDVPADPTSADINDNVNQNATVDAYVVQKAWSNTGGNLAINLTGQFNDAYQDAGATLMAATATPTRADGSDATASGAGASAKTTNGAIGTGGIGGTADSSNDNDGSQRLHVGQHHHFGCCRRGQRRHR